MVAALEYVVFGIVVAANLSLGLYFSFRKAPTPTKDAGSTEADVFLGGRALKVLPLAASSVASLVSSTGLVGFPAHYYAYGMHMAWTGVTPLLFLPLATNVIVPVIYKLGITSIFEVSGKIILCDFLLLQRVQLGHKKQRLLIPSYTDQCNQHNLAAK